MANTFPIINDQTGDERAVSVKQFAGEYQAQGYRIVDVRAYDTARRAADLGEDDEPVAPEVPTAEQSRTDAAELTAEQYPDAKPAAADRLRKRG